ncbi:autotransporter assembly complex protein TamA [Neiella marina]|uniref:Translocation and assembly module subunit TamA n=1 Tax=Neiella holothuriorum TaxID=2870530 RepID=A0ABS7EFK9_9GAMM|nr:autotransporter assembly complex family protein [Neiella holothuriorum]MBW8191000.1 autotransporter assembly complex protein TamA [Neiella holothuriorum]
MPFRCFILVFVALVAVMPVKAENLKLTIKAETKQQQDNIKAHLGTLPSSEQHRASFVFNAEPATEKALAALGYYQPDIDINLNKQKEPWQLTITVTAGVATKWQQVDVKITGEASALKPFQRIAQEQGLIEGERVIHSHYDQTKSALVSRAVRLGFFDGEMTTSRLEVDRKRRQANAVLHYHSGNRYQFGEISFEGSDLEPELLQTMLNFQQGDSYSLTQITALNRALVQSGYFGSVKVLPLIDQRSNNQVPILISLTPAKSHSFDVGVGYATDTKQRASITWRTPQINRYGHSQETKIEYSDVNPYVRFLYDIPLSNPNTDILQFGLGLESNEYADIESELRHARIGRKTIHEGWVRQYYLRHLDERWDILEDSEKSQFIMPGVTWANTSRSGNPVDPEAGLRQYYLLEFASDKLRSDANIARFAAQIKWLNRFNDNHRVVIRTGLGASYFEDKDLSDVPPSLRFYAGGDESIRGFAYQSLGPTIDYEDDEGNQQKITVGGRYMATGSLEYQYYLNDEWRVAAFTDAGNAFEDLEDSIDWAYSVGGGVHWLSVIGPIKLDIARSISENNPKWRLHINIGAEL